MRPKVATNSANHCAGPVRALTASSNSGSSNMPCATRVPMQPPTICAPVLNFPLPELDIGRARLSLILTRERQHVVGHVQAVGFAGRADASGGKQHVDAAA